MNLRIVWSRGVWLGMSKGVKDGYRPSALWAEEYDIQLNRAKTMLRGLGKINCYVEVSLWPESTVFDSGLTCNHHKGESYMSHPDVNG
jgi:hypothetical protein